MALLWGAINMIASKPRLSAIQLCSKPDIEANLAEINKIISQLCTKHPSCKEHLVVLPECCLYFGGKDKEQLTIAEPIGLGYMQQQLASIAKQHGIYLLAGTIPIISANGQKFTASSLLYTPNGELAAHYQKMHLFDVNVDDSEASYRESNSTDAGTTTTVVNLDQMKLGMTVCYDLRFPELFRTLTTLAANIITVPSAFTKVTGTAHWQVLLQARAIENQVYIVAANQQGTHQNGRQTFGHSMIINPWGEILAIKEQGNGYVSAEFDLDLLTKIRSDIPVASHNKFSVSLK